MTTPIPAVKPKVTDSGIYKINRPSRSIAMPTSIIPDITVAINNPAKPNCWAIG